MAYSETCDDLRALAEPDYVDLSDRLPIGYTLSPPTQISFSPRSLPLMLNRTTRQCHCGLSILSGYLPIHQIAIWS